MNKVFTDMGAEKKFYEVFTHTSNFQLQRVQKSVMRRVSPFFIRLQNVYYLDFTVRRKHKAPEVDLEGR